MRIGLGIFCSTSDGRLSTNHRLTLSRLTEENVLRVFERNLRDFVELLDMSRRLGFSIFRLGSNFVPFASHERFERGWLDKVARVLAERSELIRGFGVRVTMHPGQFVVLNSPNGAVRDRSLRELEYHFRVLDSLGLGRESVVVVHAGGAYGDKRAALRKLSEVLEENRWLLRRLALENDERYYSVLDVLEVAESFGVPVVYDHYHHKLNPSAFSFDRLLSTWRGTTPELHVSSRPDGPHGFGEHGDYLRVEDFVEMISLLPDDISVDVIPEVKKKERAIAKLVEELQQRHPRLLERLSVNLETLLEYRGNAPRQRGL